MSGKRFFKSHDVRLALQVDSMSNAARVDSCELARVLNTLALR
jgi:hypothetical protein